MNLQMLTFYYELFFDDNNNIPRIAVNSECLHIPVTSFNIYLEVLFLMMETDTFWKLMSTLASLFPYSSSLITFSISSMS